PQQWVRQGGQVADGPNPDPFQPERRRRPASRELAERQWGEERRLIAGGDHHEAARLAKLRGHLGDQLAAGDTDAEIEPAVCPDLVPKAERDRARRAHQHFLAGETKERLIQGNLLDERVIAIESGSY